MKKRETLPGYDLLNPDAELQAEAVLNRIMPTFEQGLENHFRRTAPSCARLEYDQETMSTYVCIPGRSEVFVYSFALPYHWSDDPEKQRMWLEHLHRCAGILGVDALRYVAQTMIDESDLRGMIDCYYDRLGTGYRFMTDPHVQLNAAITELSALNQRTFKDNPTLADRATRFG